MGNINTEFFDAYKRLNKLCNEMYDTNAGVTAYIDDMLSKDSMGTRIVPGWRETLATLKKLRWVRNQLAHEANVSMDEDFCDRNQVIWLENFREQIMATEDPIAQYRRYFEKQTSVKRKGSSKPQEQKKPPMKHTEKNEGNQGKADKGSSGRLFAGILISAIVLIVIILLYFR